MLLCVQRLHLQSQQRIFEGLQSVAQPSALVFVHLHFLCHADRSSDVLGAGCEVSAWQICVAVAVLTDNTKDTETIVVYSPTSTAIGGYSAKRSLPVLDTKPLHCKDGAFVMCFEIREY